MRRGHPARRRKLSAGVSLAALSHYRNLRPAREITSLHSTSGLVRKRPGAAYRAARCPNLAAPTILTRSNFVATMTRRVALSFLRNNQLMISRELPFRCACAYKRRCSGISGMDRAARSHRWLRDVRLVGGQEIERVSRYIHREHSRSAAYAFAVLSFELYACVQSFRGPCAFCWATRRSLLKTATRTQIHKRTNSDRLQPLRSPDG